MVADPQADRDPGATSHAGPGPAPDPAPEAGPGAAPDAASGSAPGTLVDPSSDDPTGTGSASVAESLPDGALGARVAAITGLDLAARPDAFAALDAAIVAELRAIEDL